MYIILYMIKINNSYIFIYWKVETILSENDITIKNKHRTKLKTIYYLILIHKAKNICILKKNYL